MTPKGVDSLAFFSEDWHRRPGFAEELKFRPLQGTPGDLVDH
jgi:hypothetical protein